MNSIVAEINDAIARGVQVTARQADAIRRGQPNRGVQVVVTQAFAADGDRVSVTARGYRGRFRVTQVEIADRDWPASPDTY